MKISKARFIRVMPYSLIELLAAMTVFTLLMLALMGFLNSAQKIWTGSNSKNMMFEDARVALNLMARDLQEIIYNDSCGGFKFDDSGDNKMAFSTRIDGKPNTSCKSNIAIVKWEYDSTSNVLTRMVEGDSGTPSYGGTLDYATVSTALNATTNSHEVIERVVGFQLGAYKSDMGAFANGDGKIPYFVTISLSLLDQDSYNKWKATGLSKIRDNNMRTFSKYIFIGDRGQTL